MKVKSISELPQPGTFSQSFNSPDIFNGGSVVICGSTCYFGENFILTTLFRDDMTNHNYIDPTHLNIQRKFEKILVTGSKWTVEKEKISGLNDSYWLPHSISWNLE